MLTPGTEVGGYRVEGLLGRGGMGIVYEATQHSLGRRIALKLLAAELSLDQSFRRRFEREGRLQAGLDHAHIVPIYEAGELEDHGLFIAMRLVRGATLKQLIRAGELDGQRLLTVLRPVADALDTAHEADLVHRDIKPQNILVGRRDHAYLADFGLTRAPGDTAFTKTGQFVGTLDYIAPEQIRGEPPTPGSDLYSFAAVAYECLTGSVPFPRPNDAAVLFAHMSDPPPRPSDRAPGLPAAVDDVIAAGMAKTSADRPPSILAFIQSLESALGSDAASLRLGPPDAPAELFEPASGTYGGTSTAAAEPAGAPTAPARTRPAPARRRSRRPRRQPRPRRWRARPRRRPRPPPRRIPVSRRTSARAWALPRTPTAGDRGLPVHPVPSRPSRPSPPSPRRRPRRHPGRAPSPHRRRATGRGGDRPCRSPCAARSPGWARSARSSRPESSPAARVRIPPRPRGVRQRPSAAR